MITKYCIIDNALAALQDNITTDVSNRSSWRVHNAEDLLLPIPSLYGNKKRSAREGISRSTLHFLQNSLSEPDPFAAVEIGHNDKKSPIAFADSVRIISRLPMTIIAPKVSNIHLHYVISVVALCLLLIAVPTEFTFSIMLSRSSQARR